MGGAPGCSADRNGQTPPERDKRINPIRPRHSRFFRNFAALAVLLALAGCFAPFSRSGDRSNESSLAPIRLTEEQPRSKKIGKEFMGEARRQFRFVRQPDITDAVTQVGQSILAANGEDPQTFHFLVVREDIPNAFAVPGGYIFVFDGLLSRMDSVDELAGVLSHEIGHVKKDHFFKEDKKADLAGIAGIVAALVTREPGAAIAGMATAESLGLSFSREHEREADSVGLRYLNQAGYDPAGLLNFFKTLEAYEQYNPSLVPAYFSTHPAVEEREATMQMLIRSLPPRPEGAAPVTLDWDRIRAIVEIEENPKKPPSEFFLDPTKKTYPDDKVHFITGLFYVNNSQSREAVTEFGEAIRIKPDSSLYHSAYADALFRSGRVDDAESEAEKSLSLDPRNGEAEMVLGFVEEAKRETGSAIDHFEKAKALRSADPTICFKLGSLYASRGDRKETFWNLARYYRLDMQTERAFNELQKAREAFAGDRPYRQRVEDEMMDILREGL